MTQPPEYAPERTQTQRLADDITTACTTIRRNWPYMLKPLDTQPPGASNRAGTNLTDHDRSEIDTNRITRTISLRRFALDQLRAWAQAVIEDRDITSNAVPDGHDVPAIADFVARHADWLSGQDYGPDCRDELHDLGNRCANVAFPTRRESMSIGRCPLEIPGEQDVLETCGGDVRYRHVYDERDGEAMATCSRCGDSANVTWWERRMFDDPELRRTLTVDDVITLYHRQYGEVVKAVTVRQWLNRGIIEPSGKDDKGRTLFDRDAVTYAIDRWKRRAALNA